MSTATSLFSAHEICDWVQSQPIDPTWSFAGYAPSQTGKWTHDYHRYPAKFIPQLVEKLLDEYISQPTAHINDPFMGSGTTIATAISRGFMASGTDINKIAYLISKVKARPIEPSLLEKKIRRLLSRLDGISSDGLFYELNPLPPLVPEKHRERLAYWFPETSILALGKILAAIREESDADIRDFFTVAFSHILKSCSIWLQGSNKPTRDLKKTPAEPLSAFQRHLRRMQKGNAEFYAIVPPAVRENPDAFLRLALADARHQPVEDESVDMVITSSPYVTSYEYADLHQLSTLWLDFADTLSEYRKAFIGTSCKRYENPLLKSEIAKGIVERMAAVDKKIAKEIEAFFVDMQEVIAESYRILKFGGRCAYVIGNTKLRGVEIQNAEVFAEQMQLVGFKLERVIVREIPSKILPQKRDEKTG
ncbi:MAG: DNA methyltransferase [Chloroherpetonaceae bacterium]|nr:DNA methyltransferase [Chloroherpetonaceae bacterium]